VWMEVSIEIVHVCSNSGIINMSDSQILKKLTPSPVRKYLRKLRDNKVAAEFSGLSNAEVFEKIYEEKRWGHSNTNDRKYSSGDGTRDREIVEEYVDAVTFFLSKNPEIKSGLDLGCGDFSVGVEFCDLFQDYCAMDVAKNVIRENKDFYKSKNVKFSTLDLSSGKIPRADVIFVRQVLQHLSNTEIKKFVKNIEGKFQHLIVTESLSKSLFFRPNKDINTGPGIRIHKKSGVMLEKEPFNLKFAKLEVIMEEAKGGELFVTKIYSV
jgi:hypothetical protein